MNIDKRVIETVSNISGIPEKEIGRDSFLVKDLNLSDAEVGEILSDLSTSLGFALDTEGRDIKTIQDIIEIVHDCQMLS